MSYINSIVVPGETIIQEASISYWIIFNPFYLIIFAILKIWSTEMALTNRRIIYKSGFISRNTTEFPIQKIESINVRQGILGRIFGIGEIIISGTGSNVSHFKSISSPLQFKQAIDKTVAANN
jgi:uncharacterized membrane protein YdbT with pleckstrin-like domain